MSDEGHLEELREAGQTNISTAANLVLESCKMQALNTAAKLKKFKVS